MPALPLVQSDPKQVNVAVLLERQKQAFFKSKASLLTLPKQTFRLTQLASCEQPSQRFVLPVVVQTWHEQSYRSWMQCHPRQSFPSS
jgi:hypothetical protein